MGKTTAGVEVNCKAIKFRDFIIDNNLNAFSIETIDDEYHTVVFRSRIEAKGQLLPLAVLIDTSAFIIIRTQLVSGAAILKREKVQDYFNQLNAKYKTFKYYYADDNTVFLDICIPSGDHNFDCNLVNFMLRVLVEHLEKNYGNIMEQIWE